MKDYYLILGVDPASTIEEIKTAYRQRAKNLHPDYYGLDSEPFLELQEAYSILSDPGQRFHYDKLNKTQATRKFRPQVEIEPLIPSHYSAEPLIPHAPFGDEEIVSFAHLFDRIWQLLMSHDL